MREATQRSILVVWALLLIVSELHSSHAQIHGRIGWKPGGKKRSFSPSSLDNRRQWTQNQRKRSYSLSQDTPTMTLIHNIAKSLARKITLKAFENQQQSTNLLTTEWSSGSSPSEEERLWQWNN
ncbi:uncharacterized protein [Amphiura filiformis]|uniref:uncharacterized protein n=1 Tax=Amphiura filiformis TaxID=82378 RepID=UPI003B20D5B3